MGLWCLGFFCFVVVVVVCLFVLVGLLGREGGCGELGRSWTAVVS